MNDEDLKKLLSDIHVPEPDENEKLAALNLAQSRFQEISQKNKHSRQGSAKPSRLTDVIKLNIQKLTGATNMKTSYKVAGGLAIGALAFSLLTTTGLYDSMKPTQFSKVSAELAQQGQQGASSDAANPMGSVLESIIGSSEQAALVEPAAPPAPPMAAVPPPAPPVPALAYNSAPKKRAEVAADAAPQGMMAGRAANMAESSVSGYAPSIAIAPYDPYIQPAPEENRDKFENVKDNAIKVVKEEPVSTFSIDVDTAAYSVVRRSLMNGTLPPKDAVRIEEMVNYFDYDYEVPVEKAVPFKPTVAVYQTPWNPNTQLLHIGIKGHELPKDAVKPKSNLVFLLDVSGSMNQQDKLPLLKNAFRMLVDTLGAEDTVSIVTYAGNAGIVLEPTAASDKAKILSALDSLQPGGGTAGGEGIRQAYELAERSFKKDGVNRVLLATDGDFNVGINDPEQLKDFIERKRDTGVYLSVLGFGRGNYNDALMQKLAQNGNGNAAYIDTLNEARKVLVDEASSTLYPIAGDVKIQVEFNPAAVAEYRLIGYETRMLNREDFNNDKVDAGDIGAGHTVTAIYEITPAGSKAKLVDDLRYGEVQKVEEKPAAEPAVAANPDEIGFLKLRYKLPGEKESQLITRAITKQDETTHASDDVRFAAAVAGFGQLLRNDTYTQNYTFDDVLTLAQGAKGADEFGYRAEFINLVRLAKTAQDQQALHNGVYQPR
ncbi:MAG: VWA domain-containing protein [Alphaproteobacteria bacterium]|nr:VWA domain-containing protein [Alphaproteobacteria bacterium]